MKMKLSAKEIVEQLTDDIEKSSRSISGKEFRI